MNQAVLTTIAITGFVVAFFHSAIPTHWLPFVLAARVQRWSHARTLAITALAGTGHVLMTATLGFLATFLGIALSDTIGNWFPKLAAGFLWLFGLYFVLRQIRGKGHVHFQYPHEHLHDSHPHAHPPSHGYGVAGQPSHSSGAVDYAEKDMSHRTSDRVAITSLLMLLTLSPCEAFIPIYVSGIRYGWSGFGLLTAILSVGTVTGMVLFTGLTLAGTKRLQLAVLEKYESGLMGFLLCVVGTLILILEA